jgi:hypothetical protein
MTDELEPVDCILIDRLVDGQMSHDERRRMLLECEANPERWRAVALAFVEAQALSCELKMLVKGSSVPESKSFAVAQSDTSVPPAKKRSHGRSAGPSLWRSFVLAATVLLALSLGFGAGTASNILLRTALTGGSTEGAVANTDRKSRPLPDSLYMLVQDEAGESVRPLEIPIVESPADNLEALAQPFVLPDEIAQLRRHGHQVEQTRRFYPVHLDDGRTVVVPIDDIRVNFRVVQ